MEETKKKRKVLLTGEERKYSITHVLGVLSKHITGFGVMLFLLGFASSLKLQ